MQKAFILIALLMIPAIVAVEGMGYHHKKKDHEGPKRWSAETSFYLGPAAGECPYADSHFGGSVALDLDSKAARFDTRWNTKGAKAHTIWIFKNEKTINFYYFDREGGECKTHNKTVTDNKMKDHKVELSYKDRYSIGSQMVDFYSFKSGNYRAMLSITAQGRLPVRAIGTKANSLLYSVDYLSPHYGFNPFTFELPSECSSSNATPLNDEGMVLLAEGYYMMHHHDM
ncbi:hypothetical protein PROFUN_06069 [Planoprotostelium fungivorum]|uniref:Uncharacterized protein n=1 Tax=Planoprotostelium fungivorum TaxID=1890364 RepID=A0A2P6NPR6_9EUKA|nr:hypothetical protein PROFUN_06069 [Planoprotostelium fungivorum]